MYDSISWACLECKSGTIKSNTRRMESRGSNVIDAICGRRRMARHRLTGAGIDCQRHLQSISVENSELLFVGMIDRFAVWGKTDTNNRKCRKPNLLKHWKKEQWNRASQLHYFKDRIKQQTNTVLSVFKEKMKKTSTENKLTFNPEVQHESGSHLSYTCPTQRNRRWT